MNLRARQHGFVLILTMWILAAIAIAAVYFADRVQKSLQLAQQRQSTTDAQIALSDARAETLFRLATTPLSPQGLGAAPAVIALDDRPYRLDNIQVQIQDARGLFNLNQFGDEQMRRFLSTVGVPANLHDTMIDTLRDYADADDFQRLNGAEAAQYKAKGLPPPPNAPLLSPTELRRVIGWRDQPQWQAGSQAFDWVSADETVALNPNTAPWQVLTSLPGVTEVLAKAIIERRQVAPLGTTLLSEMLGVELSGVPPQVIAFPAAALRVTLRTEGLPWGLRYNVRLTPLGDVSPWQITHFYRLEKNVNAGSSPDATDLPTLPPRVVLPATSTLPAPG